jgi:hypothetical protein
LEQHVFGKGSISLNHFLMFHGHSIIPASPIPQHEVCDVFLHGLTPSIGPGDPHMGKVIVKNTLKIPKSWAFSVFLVRIVMIFHHLQGESLAPSGQMEQYVSIRTEDMLPPGNHPNVEVRIDHSHIKLLHKLVIGTILP